MSSRTMLTLMLVAVFVAGWIAGTLPREDIAHAQDRADSPAMRAVAVPHGLTLFPATENADVARAYATAYIVAEALRDQRMDTAEIAELVSRVNRSLR